MHFVVFVRRRWRHEPAGPGRRVPNRLHRRHTAGRVERAEPGLCVEVCAIGRDLVAPLREHDVACRDHAMLVTEPLGDVGVDLGVLVEELDQPDALEVVGRQVDLAPDALDLRIGLRLRRRCLRDGMRSAADEHGGRRDRLEVPSHGALTQSITRHRVP